MRFRGTVTDLRLQPDESVGRLDSEFEKVLELPTAYGLAVWPTRI